MWESLWNLEFHPLPWAGVILVTLMGAAVDVRTRRIPNKLTGPFLLAGLILALVGAPGFEGVGHVLRGIFVAGLPYIALWLIGGGGAGDAKMMLGVGAWLGWPAALVALLAVAIAGGVLVIFAALANGRLGQTLLNVPRLVIAMPYLRGMRHEDRAEMMTVLAGDGDTRKVMKVAYGPAIFLGVCAAAVWTWWSV
jgi:Flp pilus assembly protein protease CpaA